MVHHDNALGRLTDGSGALLGKTAAELKAVAFKNTPERMMTLGDLCSLVAGRVPLVIEVKSHFDGDRRLVKRMAEVLATYSGSAVGMSFDPDQVMALRELSRTPRGIVADANIPPTNGRKPRPNAATEHLRHLPHPATFRRYWVMNCRQRPGSPATFWAAAADLDRAHPRAARPRRAPCRPDNLRGVPAGNLMRSRPP
jgi:glycerophosphoryl diester phosphodiesterase